MGQLNKSAVLTLVERTSRILWLSPSPAGTGPIACVTVSSKRSVRCRPPSGGHLPGTQLTSAKPWTKLTTDLVLCSVGPVQQANLPRYKRHLCLNGIRLVL